MSFDSTLPADARRWDLAAGDIRTNNEALETAFGPNIDLSSVDFGDITADTADIEALSADDIIAKGPITDVRAYGAVGDDTGIGDGTDDTIAIQAAVAASSAGDTLWFPGTDTITGYRVTETILVPAGINILMDADMVYDSVANESCLEVSRSTTTFRNMYYRIRVKNATNSDWTNNNLIGFKIEGRLTSSKFDIVRAEGFTVGVRLFATSGTHIFYCLFNLFAIRENKYGIDIFGEGEGLVNDNMFFNGNFFISTAQGTAISGEDRAAIRVSQTAGDPNFFHQDNIFYKPSINMQEDFGVHETLALLVNQGNKIRLYDARTEGTDEIIMRVENESTQNMVHSPYKDLDITDNSDKPGGDRATANYVVGTTSRGGMIGQYSRAIWHSGNLLDRITAVDGNTNYHIPGIAHFDGSVPILSSYPLWKSADAPISVSGYFTPKVNDGIGVFIDTVTAKRFLVSRDVDPGFNGRMAAIPYDSDGNILVYSSGDDDIVASDMAWSDDEFGGSYRQTSDGQVNDIYFECSDAVQKVAIIFKSDPIRDLRIRSFGIYSINTSPYSHDIAVYPGYEEVMPGGRLIDGTVPTTGTYELGARLWDKTAAASTAAGQVCVASGTFSSAIDAGTADTDGSTGTIINVSNTADFFVGDFVTVSAGFPTSSKLGENIFKILDVQTSTITIDTASNSGVTNITIQTVDPVFKAMASHGA